MCNLLACRYDSGIPESNFRIVGADLKKDQTLRLKHNMHRGIPRHHAAAKMAAAHTRRL